MKGNSVWKAWACWHKGAVRISLVVVLLLGSATLAALSAHPRAADLNAPSAQFALSTVIAMHPAMNNQRRVQYAYAASIPATRGKDENWGELGRLLFDLAPIWMSLLGTGERQRLKIVAFTSLALVIELGTAGVQWWW